MAVFSATPYAYGGPFFYFGSLDEYEDKYKKNKDKDTGLPYEEYEIVLQDGDATEFAVYKAMASNRFGLPQHQIEEYFDRVEEIGGLTDAELAAIAFLTEELNMDFTDAVDKYDEVYLFEGDKEAAMEDYVDQMGGVGQLGDRVVEMYFDYDNFGRNLKIEGSFDPMNDEDRVTDKPDPSDYEDGDDDSDYLDELEQFEEYEEAQQQYDRMSNQDLGYYVVDDVYGGVGELSKDQQEYFFDFEAFARDTEINGEIAEFRHDGTLYTVTNVQGL
jgi:antirestriction protein